MIAKVVKDNKNTNVYLKFSDENFKKPYDGVIPLQKGDFYEVYYEEGVKAYKVISRDFNETQNEWTIYLE